MTRLYTHHLQGAARAALATLVLALVGFSSPVSAQSVPESSPSVGEADVQVVNLASGTPIDVYLNGVRVASGIEAQSATALVPVLDRRVVVTIAKSGSSASVIAYEQFLVEGGRTYHVVYSAEDGQSAAREETGTPALVVFGSQSAANGTLSATYFNATEQAHDVVLDGSPVALMQSPRSASPSVELRPSTTTLHLGAKSFDLPLAARDGENVLIVSVGAADAKAVSIVLPTGEFQEIQADAPNKRAFANEDRYSVIHPKGIFPNPFVEQTTLTFELDEAADVSLSVFDNLGRRFVNTDAGYFSAGVHSLPIRISRATPGSYAYRLTAVATAGASVATGRMVVVR